MAHGGADAFQALLHGYAYQGRSGVKPVECGARKTATREGTVSLFPKNTLPYPWTRLETCSICAGKYPKTYSAKKRLAHLEECTVTHNLSVSDARRLVEADIERLDEQERLKMEKRAQCQTLFDAVVSGRMRRPKARFVSATDAHRDARRRSAHLFESVCVSPPRQRVAPYPSLYNAARFEGTYNTYSELRVDTSDNEEQC